MEDTEQLAIVPLNVDHLVLAGRWQGGRIDRQLEDSTGCQGTDLIWLTRSHRPPAV